MISKKLSILKALTAHLEGINPDWTDLPEGMTGETCPYDLRGSVFRGRTEFGDDVALPFIALLEAPRQFDPNGGGVGRLVQDEDWTILIQGFAKEDRKTHSIPPTTCWHGPRCEWRVSRRRIETAVVEVVTRANGDSVACSQKSAIKFLLYDPAKIVYPMPRTSICPFPSGW